MEKFTYKEYKKEFKKIQKYFNLSFVGSIDNKNSIITKRGKYDFYFDDNSIMGKFEDLKIENLPPKIQACNNQTFIMEFYPNLNSGKMNFYFHQVFEFINTIDRILA